MDQAVSQHHQAHTVAVHLQNCTVSRSVCLGQKPLQHRRISGAEHIQTDDGDSIAKANSSTTGRLQIVRTVLEFLRSGMVDDAEAYTTAFSAILGQAVLTKVLGAVVARKNLLDTSREARVRSRQGTPDHALLEPW